MLSRLYIAGYRSVRDLQLGLSGGDVLVGPNGCGKTNLYRALLLLANCAQGHLATALADEGGIASVLSATAGDRCTNLRLGCRLDDWMYELTIGLPALSPEGRAMTAFGLDPEVQTEQLTFHGSGRAPVVFLDRSGTRVRLRGADGRTVDYPHDLLRSETALSQLRDPQQYPELTLLRGHLAEWRFYHQFRTDDGSPLRRPHVGVFTPVLAHDGRDLAAALQTVIEHGGAKSLFAALARAFPGSELRIDVDSGRAMFEVQMAVPAVGRPLRAFELSDGTLRFLCLLAVLLGPRPPDLLVINEPETSLHQDLLPALAELVADAMKRSQVLMTTHSQTLATAIAASTNQQPIQLRLVAGATTAVGRGRYE